MKFYYIVFENKEPFLCQTTNSEAALKEARKFRGEDAFLKSFTEIDKHKAAALKGITNCHYIHEPCDSRYFVVKVPNFETLWAKSDTKCGLENKIAYFNVCALESDETEALSTLVSDEVITKIGERLKIIAEDTHVYRDCNISLEIKPSVFTGDNQAYLRIEKDGSVRGYILDVNEITKDDYSVLCKHGAPHI